MQYWKTYQKDIISTCLNMACEQKIRFTIWQIKAGGTRVTFPAELIEASQQNCRIKIIDDEKLEFVKGEPFYAHIESLDIIFKRENYNLVGTYLDFSLPSDLQVFEKRQTKRFYYKYQDHKNITFCSTIKDSNNEPEFKISSFIVDISTSGAGLVLGKEHIDKIKAGDDLLLEDITDQKLPTPFKVKISYIRPYQSNEIDMYKIGIAFNDQLDSISYKSITSLIEIKQIKTQGLRPDQYCGLDEEGQINTLNNIEVKNKVLAVNIKDNIEYLDRLRYMTVQMKVGFLKTVNQDVLAVALRLSSKELIYELFSELTDTMQEEFLDKLNQQRPASAVCKAQDEIIKIIRDKEATGEIMLDPKAFVTYV